MKDKMKDFEKVIQEEKPKGADVKCAEIKAIPSGTNGLCDKQKNVFRIGEYNRATASFEMNSTEDLRHRETMPKFDLSSDVAPCHYFKSSFARSVVVNSNSSRSKSLDYAVANRNGFAAKEEEGSNGAKADGRFDDGIWILGKENWDLRRAQPAEVRDDESSTGSVSSDPTSGSPLKKCNVIEDHSKNHSFLSERPASRAGSSYQKYLSVSGVADKRFDEGILRSPLTSSCRSSFHRSYSSASDVDSVVLQSQVTTLQWQLRQAEASRQMYRAVMEQVMSFLQKTHASLEALRGRPPEGDSATISRVPRSRSVHAVDAVPPRLSPPPPDVDYPFQKAKSFAQIGDPDCPKHGAMFRDASWRRARRQQQHQQRQTADEIDPGKLSEEAFRLLRTVKSLLSTKEPDLASRLGTACSSPSNPADASSASSTVSAALDSDASDSHPAVLPKGSPPPPRPRASDPRRRHSLDPKASPPQLSFCSADDESGFSSLNSFQEVGLPTPARSKATEGFRGTGLPSADGPECKVHRRWSSTPADALLAKLRPPSLCADGDVPACSAVALEGHHFPLSEGSSSSPRTIASKEKSGARWPEQIHCWDTRKIGRLGRSS